MTYEYIFFYFFFLFMLCLGMFLWETFGKKKILRQKNDLSIDILNSCPLSFLYESEGNFFSSRKLLLMFDLLPSEVKINSIIEKFSEVSQKEFYQKYIQLKKMGNSFEILIKDDFELKNINVLGRCFKKGYIFWFYDKTQQENYIKEIIQKNNEIMKKVDLFKEVMNEIPLGISIQTNEKQILFQNKKDKENTIETNKNSFKIKLEEKNGIVCLVEKIDQEETDLKIQDMDKAEKRLFKELSIPICVFNASAKLVYVNKSFISLWNLESSWIKKEPNYIDFLDKLQEKGGLPDVKDFALYKKEQMEQFSKMLKTTETFLCMPNNEIIRQVAIPYSKGGILIFYEVKK